MLHPDTILEQVRQHQAELARDIERQRLARPGAWIARTFRRLAARGAMHGDGDTRISRGTGGRT